MGGLAPELGGACFVQGPPALGFAVAFVIKNVVFRAFGSIVFFSKRAFAITTKVSLRQYVKLFAKKRENGGNFLSGSGQTQAVFLLEAKLVFEKLLSSRQDYLKKHRENTCNLPPNVILPKNPRASLGGFPAVF